MSQFDLKVRIDGEQFLHVGLNENKELVIDDKSLYPAGNKGPDGDKGLIGDKGPDGDKGLAGDKGPTGDKGPVGMNWKGAWTADTDYIAGDTVSNGGNSYRRRADGRSGATFDSSMWDLIAQGGGVADGAITNAKLGSLSVTPNKATFFSIGKNIFDKNQTLLPNSQISATGVVGSNASWSQLVSDFIPVDGEATYTHNSIYSQVFAEYDVNRMFIQKSGNLTKTTPYTLNASTRFIRIQISEVSIVAGFQLEKGSVSTTYEEYELRLSLTNTPIKATGLTATLFASIFNSVWSGVPLKAINPLNTTFLTVGKNIFDKNQVLLANARISGSAIQTNASFTSTVTDYIPVDPATQYIHESVFNVNYVEYDANKVVVNSGSVWNKTGTPITTNALTRFIRFQIDVPRDSNAIQVEKGNVATFYEAYQEELNKPINRAQVLNVLAGMNNRISLPAKIYIKKGAEDSIYFKPVVWRWMRDTFFFRFSNMLNGATRAVVTANANVSSTMSIYNADFDVVASKAITLMVADMTRDTGNFNFLPIGDSYTEPGSWTSWVKNNCPNITLLGIRRGHPSSPAGIVSEGRSGWTLNNYFTAKYSQFNDFSPFLQPVDPYLYYANTACWKNVLAAGSTHTQYATAIRIGFNASTGYKSNPAVNDVMYVDANSRYEVWDGSAWVAITEAALNFSFNFAKYRSAWGIALPNLVSLMLGVNDFSGMHWRNVASAFAVYKTQLDTLIASVKADNATTKFALMLPTSAFGELENQNDIFSPSRNAAMFIARELMIQYYDGREAEGIYVVDSASAMDSEYGSHKDALLPFPEYVTQAGWNDETRKSVRDAIHPDNGYYQIAKRMAAFIQFIR